MGLSLSAEQKELRKIFKIDEQYVIPSYQRPYSWEYDQCFQLYNDLQSAFDSRQDYFIGNIIIAKAEYNKDTLEVVDGQQRLVTCLLLFKVLHLFVPEMKGLLHLLEKDDIEGNETVPRIRSEVFEANDDEAFRDVLKYDMSFLESRYSKVIDKSGRILERKCESQFEANLLHFYSWLKFFQENRSDIKEFITYLLQHVYLLPIELTGKTQEEANEKALVIFETINNRGMNLEDADIFKAKLYNRAKSIGEEKIFIEQWTVFKSNCDNLGLAVDDVFRYYSHVIRGKEGITSSEKNIREFFSTEKFSPIILKKYMEVLSDLFKIVEILEMLHQESAKATAIAKWLQVIEAYSNQYPKYAIVNYLFVNNLQSDEYFESFLKALIRYTYYQGSTSTVKFEIYNIIKQISSGEPISSYTRADVNPNYFKYLGRLKKGYALLAFYVTERAALPTYYVDKIVGFKDKTSLHEDWAQVPLEDVVDSLGNFVILDIPKKELSFSRKAEHFSRSRIDEVRSIFKNGIFTYDDFRDRDQKLKMSLANFFIEK